MLGRRMGRGGLLRVAATTAVVAVTATAVSGGMRGRQDAKAQQAAEAQAYEQEQQQAQVDAAAAQAAAAQAAAAPVPAAPAASGTSDLMTQIQSLSDDEFTAAKAKLLT